MVKMASKLTFGPAIADWQERINTERLRDYRTGRVRKLLRQRGIPTLLEAFTKNIRYLTGIKGALPLPMTRYVLFFADHNSVLFEHAGSYHQLPDQAPWIKHWRIARCALGGIGGPGTVEDEMKLFGDEIHQELKDRGLDKEPLAVSGLDGASREALRQRGLDLVDGSALMMEAQAIKSVDEVNCLKMVAAITDSCWYAAWENMRPGVKDIELSSIVQQAAFANGAEDAGPGGWFTGPLTFDRGFSRAGRVLQVGDLVYGSLCANSYMGYRSCSYRTFVVGRQPNAQEKDWYQRLLERLNNVIEAIKPGATTADAARHFPPASAWGYKEEEELLSMEIGHGIGLIGSYDIPVVNRQWSLAHPQVFEEGMCLAVEGREGVPRVGGVRFEDMLVVTRNGAELMDYFPRDEISVAPR
ncbi:MAG: aminopeptidase P family protein [Chloroflexi bacterium]|nr:aminopeptidase P family protein [Chloroflexota bacterium]